MNWTTDGLTHLALHHAGWGLVDTRDGHIRAYVGRMKYDILNQDIPKLGKWHIGTMCKTANEAKKWCEERILRNAPKDMAEIGTTGGG